MHGFDNDGAWRKSFDSMFGALKMRDCTPTAVLDTMSKMPRFTNRLEDITIACRSRNIAASDEGVLDCLRSLWKDGKIEPREIADRHFFIYQPK